MCAYASQAFSEKFHDDSATFVATLSRVAGADLGALCADYRHALTPLAPLLAVR